jgi:hypothetical protein
MKAQQFMSSFSSAGRLTVDPPKIGDSYIATRRIDGEIVKVRVTWDGKEWRDAR